MYGGARFLSGASLAFENSGTVHVHYLEEEDTEEVGFGHTLALLGKWLVFGQSDSRIQLRDLDAGETIELGAVAGRVRVVFSENWLVYGVHEWFGGQDLNGDGDTKDKVLHAYDLNRGEETNLEFAITNRIRLHENRIAFWVSEGHHKKDLNADGDTRDNVLHTHDLTRGRTINLGETDEGPGCGNSFYLALSGKWLAFGSGTVHVHDLEGGETTDLDLDLINCGDAAVRLEAVHVAKTDILTGIQRELDDLVKHMESKRQERADQEGEVDTYQRQGQEAKESLRDVKVRLKLLVNSDD